MQEWWDGLSVVLKVFYAIGIVSLVIMFIQIILAFIGISHGAADLGGHAGFDGSHDFGGHDFSHDHEFGHGHDTDSGNNDGRSDGASLRLFTVQGIVSFLVVFGWTGVICTKSQVPLPLTLLLAVVLGAAMLLLTAKIFQMSQKLQTSGNVRFKDALGKCGKVYIPIPAKGEGTGKVTLTFDNRFMECEAMTEGESKLKTDTPVRVTDVRGNVLVVEVEN